MHRDQISRVKAAKPGVYRMMNVVTIVMGGAMRREFTGIPATAAEIEALPLPDEVPTIVLSSTRAAAGEQPDFRALLAQLQDEIADSHAVVRRHDFIANSGRYIQRDQPQAVINAARELAGCDTLSEPAQRTQVRSGTGRAKPLIAAAPRRGVAVPPAAAVGRADPQRISAALQ